MRTRSRFASFTSSDSPEWRTHQSGGIATVTSSSSSSSRSVSSRNGPNQVARRADSALNNHSGELSGSSESSPTTVERV
ncbi:hypothetical protein ACFX2A_006799 [Malus domestica]